jgi:hypothetical protein
MRCAPVTSRPHWTQTFDVDDAVEAMAIVYRAASSRTPKIH